MSKKRPNNKNKERQQKQNSLLHNKRVQNNNNNNNNKSLKKRSKRSFQNTKMVQHMLEERPHNRSLLAQLPAAQPAAPTSLDNTKPNAATDCSSFSGDTGA